MDTGNNSRTAAQAPRPSAEPSPGSADGGRARALRATRGVINSYLAFGTVDGPGLRFVLFLQGCPLRCLYCHNPDSVLCGAPGAKIWTAEETLEVILRYRRFFKNGGVTLSGGEPLMQPEFVHALTTLLHGEGLHVAVDTAGSEPLERVRKAIDAADMLLLDIKAIDAEVSRRLTGRDSENAFATLDYCEATGKRVWIRHVLLRGYTLDAGQLDALARRLAPYSCVDAVELLPFHKYGEKKWEEIGRPYLLSKVEATTEEETAWAKTFFLRQGLHVL